MSVVGAKAENICSQRVFRLLTHLGHLTTFAQRSRLEDFSARRQTDLSGANSQEW
jgi:hypothetical protein